MRTLSRSFRLLLGMGLLACASLSPAQTGTPRDDTLYQQLGGQPGLVKLMDNFMQRLLADARMNPFFKDVDQAHVKAQLVDQFCEVSGGPCRLNGPDMKKVHSGVDITRADFNALVEVLQQAMDAQGIAFTAQNRLLAKLAPMHRDIVNVP
ncbi:group 1 truncated hemoglobin [Ideonella sp.]|uniref:group I truncated hemoglobin n=1 Tax=Ideonella sp. TaxID=1929293 RepID=UPI0035B147A7